MRLLFSVLAICASVTVLLGAGNPFIGTWKLNTEKSKFSPGSEIRNMTITFELDGNRIKRIAAGTDVRAGRFRLASAVHRTRLAWLRRRVPRVLLVARGHDVSRTRRRPRDAARDRDGVPGQRGRVRLPRRRA